MDIAISERFNNPLSHHYGRYPHWREEKLRRKRLQHKLKSNQEESKKKRKNSFDGADFYDDVLAVGAALLTSSQNIFNHQKNLHNGMVLSYGGLSFVADSIHVSKAFNGIINQKLAYEKDALNRINKGTFQGPLPQDQHNIRNAFNGALPKTEKQKLASLRGFVEYNGECHLTNDGLKGLGNIYKDAATENGSEPVFVFRQTLPTTSLNRDNRDLVNEGQPAPIYAHA